MKGTLCLIFAFLAFAQTDFSGTADLTDYCKVQGKAAELATGAPASASGKTMCSQTIQGLIPDVENMVSALITAPADGSTQSASKGFKVTFIVTGMASGFFGNPATDFMKFPQSLDPATGRIQGVSALSIQKMTDKQAPPGSKVEFFQLLKEKDDGNGQTRYTVNIAPGALKSTGIHRACTANLMAGLTPVIMPVAQRGAQDDCIRINVTS
jgi:hypothetical protein